MVKNPPIIQETQVRSLGLEGSLGEGNSNPLQFSCLENSIDRGIWRAAVHGVSELGMTEQLTHIEHMCAYAAYRNTFGL